MSRKLGLYLILLMLLLAFALGALTWGGRPDLTAAERERVRTETEQWEAQQLAERPVKVFWSWAQRVILAIALAGGVTLVWLYGARCAITVYPSRQGIFPLFLLPLFSRRPRQGANPSPWRIVVIDSNRLLSPGTRIDPDGHIVYALPPGLEAEQAQTTARAQWVQAVAARNYHPPAPDNGRNSTSQARAPELPDGEAETHTWRWPSMVPLRDILNGGSSIEHLALGVTLDPATGETSVVRAPMGKLIHIGVGGSSGWGKSVFLQSLCYQLITAREQPQLAMVDLKRVTLSIFNASDRLMWPVATNEIDAVTIFDQLAGELQRRLELMEQAGVLDIDQYNAQATQPLQPIIMVADECTYLLKDTLAQKSLHPLMWLGRSTGLWMIMAGQNWTTKFVPSEERDQFSTRIQFKAMSKSQSRVLIERSDAESLRDVGRAYAVVPGQDLIELQAPIVKKADIIAALTDQRGPRNPLPASDDVSEAEMIRQLAAEGLSQREIEQRVFGHVGGSAYRRVKAVLDAG